MNKNKILKALSWNFIGTYGNQGVLFLIGIILARILAPKDFGLISMIIVFSSFGQILINLGFNTAIIQKKTNTQEDLSSVFYLNVIIGFILFIVLYLSSNTIASFYAEERLINITKAMSLIFIIFAFSSIHRTLIIKRLDFKSETIAIMISSIASGTISIILAFRGYGVWALVLKIVLQKLFETVLFWIKSNWRPLFIFKIKSIKKFFNFSMNITAATLLNGLSQNIDRLIVGKIFSAEILGFFDRSKKYNNMVGSNIGNIFGKVMFPAFSDIQDDHENFLNIYRKIIKIICFFTIPFFFILVLIAKSLIIILITEKWLPSVNLLQILALSGFTYPVSMIMTQAIIAKGRANLFLKLDLIKSVLYIASVFIGAYWGIIGVVYAITIVNFVAMAINSIALSKIIKFKVQYQIKDISASLIISVVMSLFLIIITKLIEMDIYQTIIILPIIGIIIYFFINYLFNNKQITELTKLIVVLKKQKSY